MNVECISSYFLCSSAIYILPIFTRAFCIWTVKRLYFQQFHEQQRNLIFFFLTEKMKIISKFAVIFCAFFLIFEREREQNGNFVFWQHGKVMLIYSESVQSCVCDIFVFHYFILWLMQNYSNRCIDIQKKLTCHDTEDRTFSQKSFSVLFSYFVKTNMKNS